MREEETGKSPKVQKLPPTTKTAQLFRQGNDAYYWLLVYMQSGAMLTICFNVTTQQYLHTQGVCSAMGHDTFMIYNDLFFCIKLTS